MSFLFKKTNPLSKHGINVRNYVRNYVTSSIANNNKKRYLDSPGLFVSPKSKKRDVIIVGGGHNGLTTASYLSKEGFDVLLLERRDVIGGAAITEEIFDGYKFSRASYLAGLLRKSVINELNLKKYGLKFLKRNPSSFTPTKLDDPIYRGKSLMFWNNELSYKTYDSIKQFSTKDADNLDNYENYLGRIRNIVNILLDSECPDINILHWLKNPKYYYSLFNQIGSKETLHDCYELLTSPATKLLNQFFESDILKTTLATDAVIGSILSPNDIGSAYVLLHHIMGEIEGDQGIWAYVKGGMGAISNALKQCALDSGTEIICNATVKEIIVDRSNKCKGVIMDDNTYIESDIIISACNPHTTFNEMLRNCDTLTNDFKNSINNIDYNCGAFKINLVVNKLPDFKCLPNDIHNSISPQHHGTIHFESRMNDLIFAAAEAKNGIPATRPIIEMTIPSSIDNSLIKNKINRENGHHIVQLFIQYAPYDLNYDMLGISNWDDINGEYKLKFAERVFDIVDEYCNDFKSSIVYADILSPRDLEKVFGLYKGNIFHAGLGLDQIGYARPTKHFNGSYNTPINNLYLCASGTHPGGGVMGAPGRNCAKTIINKKTSIFKYD